MEVLNTGEELAMGPGENRTGSPARTSADRREPSRSAVSGTSCRSPMLAYWTLRPSSRRGPTFNSEPEKVITRQPRSSSRGSSSSSSMFMLCTWFSNRLFFSSQPLAISSTESSTSGSPELFVIWRMWSRISNGI